MSRLGLRAGWMEEEMGRAQDDARRMMDAAGRTWLVDDMAWVEAFGDTEVELREHRDALARRVRSISRLRRRERRAAIKAYISVDAMLNAAYGIGLVWG